MAQRLVIECDLNGCFQRAFDANGWFKIWTDENVVGCCPATKSLGVDEEIKIFYACGVEHARIFLDRFLTTGKLEEADAETSDGA